MSGRYDEALQIYDRLRPGLTAEDWREISARGTALMCLRRYEEAEQEIRLANQLASQEGKGSSQPYLDKLGAVLWLLGKKDEAAQTWLSEVDVIFTRKIAYTDISGGVGPVMRLWFAGTTLARSELVERSVTLARRLSKSLRIRSWPGPMAHFVLGKGKFVNVIETRFGFVEIDDLLEGAKNDRLYRRELCQAFFYWSVAERQDGNNEFAYRLLKSSVDLDTPIEAEWFLARGLLNQMQ
jgi:tetratricopeptide (TPR) repeat protein